MEPLSLLSLLVACVTLLCLWVLWARTHCPLVLCGKDSEFCERVKRMCPTLLEHYCPPLLWGRSGHIQTLAFGTISRFSVRPLSGQRHSVLVEDGSTLHYDEFCPPGETTAPYTMLVCPGIGGCSERGYIQSFVCHAVSNGFRVVVYNHLGALPGEQLTGHRIFTYGGTGDLASVVDHTSRLHPSMLYIGIGFSLGACVLMRFLGENSERRRKFVCATSVCQGYDPRIALKHMHDWYHFRRLYNYIICQKQLQLIKRHSNQLFNHSKLNPKSPTGTKHSLETSNGNHTVHSSGSVCSGHNANGFALDPSKRQLPNSCQLFRATSIDELDEQYTRRVCGFESVYELYRWTSCVDMMNSITDLPVLLVNSQDDPLVDINGEMVQYPKHYLKINPRAMFVVPHYGGHLGFFEGGVVIPHSTAWIDRLLVQYSQACIAQQQ